MTESILILQGSMGVSHQFMMSRFNGMCLGLKGSKFDGKTLDISLDMSLWKNASIHEAIHLQQRFLHACMNTITHLKHELGTNVKP